MTIVSVALPVANQADHIERVVEDYLDALGGRGRTVDLVLAVNNSVDQSLAACRRSAAAHPGLVTVVTTDAGWGHAVMGGLKAARGSIIGFANSARTHPNDLARAVDLAVANPHALIKGERRSRGYSLMRRLGSRLYNLECQLLFGLDEPDVNGNPKLWGRDALPLHLLTEPGGFLDAEILIHARRLGIPVIGFPIDRTERHGGRSMTTLGLARRLYSRPIAVRFGRRHSTPMGARGCELS